MNSSSGARDNRYSNLNFNMGLMSSDSNSESLYGSPSTSQLVAAVTSQIQDCNRSDGTPSSVRSDNEISGHRGIKRSASDVCYMSNPNSQEMSHPQTLGVSDDCTSSNLDEPYGSIGMSKKSPLSMGKKTKGRVKIKMEYIDNKLRRYTTFSKRKTGIMKKAYELSTLTGTQVMLLVASETGHVYTFATRKLQPMITSEAGKALIQTCLNSPDPPSSASMGDQRMSATGFEETELTYNIADDEQKVKQIVYGSPHGGGLHVSYSSGSGLSNVHHIPSSHSHAHLLAHSHGSSPSSYLVPCSSPNASMLSSNPYPQSCTSPIPSHASGYHPHVTHSNAER